MDEIKAGDVVQLKSGGPDITVSDTGNYSEGCGIVDGVKCVWFDGKKPMMEVFQRAALKKV